VDRLFQYNILHVYRLIQL